VIPRRALLGLLALLLSSGAPFARESTLEASLHFEWEELYPDRGPGEGDRSDWGAWFTPAGVSLGVHVLVGGLVEGESLSFELREFIDEIRGEEIATTATWYRMIDVPVEENTGLVSRTERWDGKKNPHVIRRAPFRVFEALQPVTSPLDVDAAIVALRLEIPFPPDEVGSGYSFVVELRQGASEPVRLPLWVEVLDVVVPPAGRDTLGYTNWFNVHAIARSHDLELWSEEFWTMLGRYAALMAKGRQNTFWVRWSDVFTKDAEGVPRLERARLERYVKTFTDAGLYWIEGAPFAGRPGGDWSTTTLNLGIVNLPATSEEGRAALAGMCEQLSVVIHENGWEGRWMQHLSDEPTNTNAEDYVKLAGVFRELLPGIPIIEATMSTKLAGAVDVWCPQVQEYQRHREFFEARRAAGDRLWVYTCLIPGGPWINRLLDMERLRPVYVGWAAAKYDLHGFLHWGFNHYRGDPFAKSVVPHGEPGSNNRLPAGDSHVVFPGPDGPWSGQRFEAHRLGMEDYELLRMLKAKDPEAFERVMARVFRAFDDYETHPVRYAVAKGELLEALAR